MLLSGNGLAASDAHIPRDWVAVMQRATAPIPSE
jgi:hypothetical protein